MELGFYVLVVFCRICVMVFAYIGLPLLFLLLVKEFYMPKSFKVEVVADNPSTDFSIASKMRHLEQQTKGVKYLFDRDFYSDDFKIKIFGEEQEFSIFDLVDTFHTLICATDQFLINDLSQENIATAQKVTAIAQTTVDLLIKEVERPSTLFSQEYYRRLAEELAKTNDYLMGILKPMEMMMLDDYRKQMSEIIDGKV